MWYWTNKVAIVADCGNEVGVAIVEKFVESGMIVISFGKTDAVLKKAMEKFKLSTSNVTSGKVILFQRDITNTEEMREIFEKIKDVYEGIDILVNNAYCNADCHITDGDMETIKKIIDNNITALVACTRFAAATMIERKTRGHIININDMCAYQIPMESHKSVFIASKATITSVNEILRHEFRYLNANIKVTNVACGAIESCELALDKPKLKLADVAKLVTLILNTPEHLHVHEILLESVDE